MSARPVRDGGFALLIVLWTMVLVALIGTQVSATGRGAVQVASNLRASAELEAAADGAVHEAIFRLLDPTAAGWRADGTDRSVTIGPVGVTLRLADQAGKINPNLAQPELLAAFLRQLGIDARGSASLAGAIGDWRSPAQQTRPRELLARDYRNAGLPYAPPEAPFQTLGELGLVLGMTPELLARMTPHLSLFHDGDPDAGLADPIVRQTLQSLYGPQQRSAAPRTGPRLVEITAIALRPDGARFIRRALVRLGQGVQGFLVLAWGGVEAG